MKSNTSKFNRQISIIDMFSKQLVKKKQISCDTTNKEDIQKLQNIKTENNILQESKQNKENYDPEIDEEYLDKHIEKKVKLTDINILPTPQIKNVNMFHNKCEYCRQKLNEIKFYPGHPNGAVDEEIALIDPKLCLFNGTESFIHESDQRPQNKLTYFR